ncbi:hypothetical protein [Gloeobacter morelensis]|uniref:Uncharacterized protein n=1 Tax=Gloeobacter morelensis MG652769 TaxID=2781736 RepID=A0ABY3PNX1_9CYAN|nr:hypothetical protein [Gloeobacter morelensis]UFP95386.1 hypothetical protein ISF26_03810 [Gloeobacter morelensis MG652769]
MQRLIAIVDSAKALEFNLLQRYGEIPELIIDLEHCLEQLDNIAQSAADPYGRLTNQSQPLPTTATLKLLQSTVETRFGLAALKPRPDALEYELLLVSVKLVVVS